MHHPTQAIRESELPKTGIPACALVGTMVAERCIEAGVDAVHWDRKQGDKYHGRNKAMLEAIMAKGVKLA